MGSKKRKGDQEEKTGFGCNAVFGVGNDQSHYDLSHRDEDDEEFGDETVSETFNVVVVLPVFGR